MKLTRRQLEDFDRDGYLFFPGLFKPEEIKVLTDEVPALYAQRRPENVREKGSDAVRTNFAAHMYSYPYAKLARYPRMIEPVQQIFGDALYMHQHMCPVDFRTISSGYRRGHHQNAVARR